MPTPSDLYRGREFIGTILGFHAIFCEGGWYHHWWMRDQEQARDWIQYADIIHREFAYRFFLGPYDWDMPEMFDRLE